MEHTILKTAIILSYYILGAYSTTDILRLTSYGSNDTDIRSGKCFCPSCGHKLRITDQIPIISFILCLGRCKYCSAKIPRAEFILEAFILISCSIIAVLGNFSITSFIVTSVFYEMIKIISITIMKPKKTGLTKSLLLSVLINIPIFELIFFIYLLNGYII